jgi:uncharacterized membrane protein SpoIIM required for sporulation
MRVADRLAQRESSWNELQSLLHRLDGRRLRRVPPADVLRLGELYRSACADLMLAESHDLPRETVRYLDALVGRAHNAVYRSRGFRLADWSGVIFREVPARLRADPALRLAAVWFWGLFLITALVGAAQPDLAARLAGQGMLDQVEQSYEKSVEGARGDGGDAAMAGFYIMHNAGIGLSCYAWGLLFGLGSLWTLASNAITLGTIFGHMATVPQAGNFFTFVTAHGPFELTAIVFSGAAGLRLGSGWIDTGGRSRLASLHHQAVRSLPIAGAAVILFVLAAFLEGFVSASTLPYSAKASIAVATALMLVAYLMIPGRAPREAALGA